MGKIEIRPDEVLLMDTADLKPNPKNVKLHPRSQIDGIVSSMKKFGFNDPIAVDEDNVILAGHGRLKAAKRLNLVKVPVIVIRGMSEEEKAAYTLAHNQWTLSSGFDEAGLSVELNALRDANFDLGTLGFEQTALDALLAASDEENLGEEDLLGNAGEDLHSVFKLGETLLIDNTEIQEPYGFPKIRPDMVPGVHDGYGVWVGERRTNDNGQPFLYLFGSDSTVNMPASRTTVAFYVDDVRFERVWRDLPKYTSKMLTAGVEAVIMPNFSMYYSMPKAVQIYNTYRSAYIARYWQEAGLMVIPDINFSDVDSLEYTIGHIPEGLPAVAHQIQTFAGGGDGEEADVVRTGLGFALEKLKPQTCLVYGGEPGINLGREICDRHGVVFVGILNRAAHMRRDVANTESNRVL